MSNHKLTIDLIIGVLLVLVTIFVILSEWQGTNQYGQVKSGLVVLLLFFLSLHAHWTRVIFVAIAGALTVVAITSLDDWLNHVERALQSAAFIAAFFAALTSLRHTADTSPTIQTAGRFLAQQPPGKRYLALTFGGQLYALVLNYGAIALLGSLASANALQEKNPEIRGHRLRRMLLAIQRGFIATLPWSPLAFAMAISTTLIPGANWASAFLPCLVSGLILTGVGWALDTIFKPRLTSAIPVRIVPEGSWTSLVPLLTLLAILVTSVAGLHILTNIRAVGVVLFVVPIISLVWIALQAAPHHRLHAIGHRSLSYISNDLPAYRGELILLMMAGFIGTLGSVLLQPIVLASGIDLTALPGWLVLVALVWIIPVTGQIGMNPILSVSLIAPILPEPAMMGVSPSDVIVALTAGWALTGASSPYTASTLLIGSLGNVSATRVGIKWNGAFALLSAVILSFWVAAVAVN